MIESGVISLKDKTSKVNTSNLEWYPWVYINIFHWITGSFGVRSDERAPRCSRPCRFDWFDCRWIFPW
jgi:hypothetical protein